MAYLTAESYMLARFDRESRQAGLPSDIAPEGLESWQTELRKKLSKIIGLPTFLNTPLEPATEPEEAGEGYFCQRIEISTEPGIRLPFFVLRPVGMEQDERRPVILALHGHGGGGKSAVAGRREEPVIAEKVDYYRYDYGLQLAKAGYVVLCPDARGFGERREKSSQGDTPDQILANSCQVLNNMALPLGQTVTGMWTWDLMRLIDYAATRSDCDITRLGCVGLSGGGLQTLWLAALDERVKVAVVSGYFYGYKDALLRLNENCSCNYVPGLWQMVDMGDIGALICPRPLLIESGLQDPLNGEQGIANVQEQLSITARAYNLSGVNEKLYHSVFDGPHRYDGKDVLPWFNRWFATSS
ncbi:MAG TPA: alpha/beta hydrolase family protein [Chloroflexia bacterium]|nr:alpha/beta hydrolase family protein [Chloroflexia bacterium]